MGREPKRDDTRALPPWKRAQVLRMLAQVPRPAMREIARQCGVGYDTVRRYASGYEPRERGKSLGKNYQDKSTLAFSIVHPYWCEGCEKTVARKPCVACTARNFRRSQREQDTVRIDGGDGGGGDGGAADSADGAVAGGADAIVWSPERLESGPVGL